jgi:anti-sigma factor RsiW
MTRDDVMNKLPEYLADEVSPTERSEIKSWLATDPELQRMFQFSQRLDVVLSQSTWLVPAPDFTAQVMAQLEPVVVPESASLHIWERIRTWLSLAALLPLLIFYGPTAFRWTLLQLQHAGNWLDSLTGYTLFALHPAVVLGLFAPLIAGVFATCVLSGRCRLSS